MDVQTVILTATPQQCRPWIMDKADQIAVRSASIGGAIGLNARSSFLSREKPSWIGKPGEKHWSYT
jgi:hypothetical protein